MSLNSCNMGNVIFINLTREKFLSTKLIYRYMPMEYALQTLNNQELWFAKPSTWKDPFEKRFIEAMYKVQNQIIDFPLKDKVFCMCLTQTAASEAYWNIYSRQQYGIKFSLNKEVLLKQLEDFASDPDCDYNVYIGGVEYMATADIKKHLSKIPFNSPEPPIILNDRMCVRLLLLKRNAYKYEDEVRIILVRKKALNTNGFNWKYRCLNTDIIHTITLDPSTPPATESLYKEIFINKYKFHPVDTTKGIRHRVHKSQLYTQQKITKIRM